MTEVRDEPDWLLELFGLTLPALEVHPGVAGLVVGQFLERIESGRGDEVPMLRTGLRVLPDPTRTVRFERKALCVFAGKMDGLDYLSSWAPRLHFTLVRTWWMPECPVAGPVSGLLPRLFRAAAGAIRGAPYSSRMVFHVLELVLQV